MKTATPKKRELSKAYNAWNKGKASKTELEVKLFGSDVARGKRIARAWDSRLGINTFGVAPSK